MKINGQYYKTQSDYDEMINAMDRKYPIEDTPESLTLLLRNQLQNLCNEKNEAVYNLVLGHNSSPGQIERYKNKYERAKLGEFTKKINAIIIEKYEAARKAVEFFVDMIEAFREGVADMIKDGELQRAQKAIELAQEFNHKTTMDDIKKILIGA